MSWRRELSKIKALLGRSQPAGDLDEEIRAHLNMEVQENLEAGMSREEAHYAAKRKFGNVTIAQERSREMWRLSWADRVLQDLRFGLRQLRRSPGFTTVAILTLALGIGATTATFSVVNAVLLHPLPYKDPARLVLLFETEKSPGEFPLSGADYLDWQEQNRTLEGSSLFSWDDNMSASGAAEPEPAAVARVQANFFAVLGVQPFEGRAFVRGEDVAGKNHVAVLSYGFWQRYFGGAAGTLGKTVILNNEPYTVVGIMPRWFKWSGAEDIWTPFDMSPKELGPRGNHNWNAVARVKPGVTVAQAHADLFAISQRLEKQFPNSNNKVHAVVLPLNDTMTHTSRTPLIILFCAVTMVLLVACVNVANLQLARASTRHREMAVRSSLGAGRLRLVQQMLTESILLAFAGAALGVLAAWWCVRLIESVKSLPIPRANPIQVDGSVLLFAVAVALLSGILFGLAPALQNSESSLNEEIKAGANSVLSAAAGRRALRDALVVAEICITLALLVGAGLLLRSFAYLRNQDIGINPHNLLTASISLPDAKYSTLEARRQFFDQLLDRVRHTPGVDAAAFSSEIPLRGGSNGTINVDGVTDPAVTSQLVGWNYITPDYFRTFGIRLMEGRNFTPDDLDRAAVAGQKAFDLYKAARAQNAEVKIPPDLSWAAVISQAAERTFWRNQNAVGKSFRMGDVKVTVIGVVSDVKEYGVREQPMPLAYFPNTQALPYDGYARLTVKSRTPPASMVGPIRSYVRDLDRGLALFRPLTMEEVIAEDTQDVGVQAILLGSFATLALVLAAVGLYGVMSYLVTQRTREIGIRMALGAQQANVLSLIMRQGTRLTLIGILFGVAAAFALAHSMSGILYGVNSNDPLTFASVAVLLSLVALTAYYIPARRATKVDPLLALRYE
jgi:predicted permease